jgi:co-chaperonin GroES (HSP10)
MTIVVPNQKLVLPTSSSDKSEDTSKNKIPTDTNGIKEYLESLPEPIGYRMLIRPYAGESKTKGGLILSENTQDTIAMTTVIGIVVKMGDLCYLDKEKFPTGPWCKEGQFVMYGRYAGSRFKTKYGEHRILNDDEIIGLVKRPQDILHLY